MSNPAVNGALYGEPQQLDISAPFIAAWRSQLDRLAATCNLGEAATLVASVTAGFTPLPLQPSCTSLVTIADRLLVSAHEDGTSDEDFANSVASLLCGALDSEPGALSSPDLASAAHALLRLQVTPPKPLLQRVSERVAASLPGATLDSTALMLQALAHWDFQPDVKWRSSCLQTLESNSDIGVASISQLTGLLHDMALLGLRPSRGWLDSAMLAVNDLLAECGFHDVAKLLMALELWKYRPREDVLKDIAAVVTAAVAEEQPSNDQRVHVMRLLNMLVHG